MQQLKPALQYSTGRSEPWSGASVTNCYSEKADGDKREDFAVMAVPGLVEWADIGVGPIRGRHVVSGVLYVVSGSELYSVNGSGSGVLIGAVAGSGPVRMASNYTELCIAAGGVGYVFSGGALSSPFPDRVIDVFYADGFMLWIKEDSEEFFISALDDALTYDGADITSVEGAPDNLVGGVNNHREEIFFGKDSAEIYYNSGNADFPFERQGNAFVERGCFDRDGIVKIDNSVIFVGNDRIVYRLDGYTPVRISTHAIEYLLRDATFARAFSYDQEGHKFYVLTIDRGTVVFDVATGAWHKRKSWGMDAWRANGAITAYGKTLLSSSLDGKLFTLDFDTFSEDSDPIEMIIDLPTIEGGRDYVTMNAFEVICETGVGSADVPDPQIMLSYSDNGGRTYSNEMWRTLGGIGEYRTRAVWRMLGIFRQRQMRLKITDNVRRFVISYYADIS